MKTKYVYDKVKELLEADPATRDSDKKLLWAFWEFEGIFDPSTDVPGMSFINKDMFQSFYCTAAESITRARRMVQKMHPELGSTFRVKSGRKEKALTKGTFVFRERI